MLWDLLNTNINNDHVIMIRKNLLEEVLRHCNSGRTRLHAAAMVG